MHLQNLKKTHVRPGCMIFFSVSALLLTGLNVSLVQHFFRDNVMTCRDFADVFGSFRSSRGNLACQVSFKDWPFIFSYTMRAESG